MARAITIVVDAETGGFKTKIDSVIQQTNRLSQDAIRGSQQTAAAFERSQGALGGLERRAISTRAAFGPLSSALSQGTQLLGQYSPAAGAAAGALDNLAISVLATATATGGLRGALSAAAGLLNPWVALVIGAGAALAYFTAQSAEAARKQVEFDQALKTGNLDVLKERVKAATDELKKMEDQFEKVLALQAQVGAPPGSPLARAQEQGLDPLRRKLTEASRASERADFDLANAQRNKALEGKDERLEQLKLQKELAEANERARPQIQARADIQALLNKGLREEDIVTEKLLITQKAAAQVREIDRQASEKQRQAVAAVTKESLSLQLQIAELERTEGDATSSTRHLAVALIEQEKAAALAAAAHDRQLKALGPDIEAQAKLKIALVDVTIAQKERAKTLERELQLRKDLTLASEAAARDYEEEIAFVEKLRALKRQEAEAQRNFPLQKLQASGAREGDILQEQLRALKEREQFLRNAGTTTGQITPEELRELPQLVRDIDLAETRLKRFSTITLDLGQHIANTFDTIFTAMISGTLKSVDAGRTLVATLGHMVTDTFRQVIQKKLNFELELFTNLRQLPQQMQGAFAAGASAVTREGGFPAMADALDRQHGGGGGGLLGAIGNFFSNAPGFSLGGSGLGAGIGALISLPALFQKGAFSGQQIGTTIGGTVGSIGGGILGSFFGPIGSFVGSFLGNFLGKLFGGLFNAKPPRTRGIGTTEFGGISLGPLGLELGELSSAFSGKGKGATPAIGGQIQDVIRGTLGAAIEVLNRLPRTILETLNLDSATKAIEEAGSFSINVKTKKFAAVLNEVLLGIPDDVFAAMEPLFVQGLQGQLRGAGFGALSGRAQEFLTAINPRTGFGPGPNAALPARTEAGLKALGSVFEFLNTLENVRPFTSIRERGLLESGVGRVLGADSPDHVQKRVQQFGQQFGGILQAAQDRARFLSETVSEAIDKGLLDASSGSGFNVFLTSFGDAISKTIQDSMARAFLEQQLQRTIAPRLADIFDIFSRIGQGRTGEEALSLAQPQITSLIGELGTLRPIFDAMLDLIRQLQGQVRGQFGIPDAAGGTSIVINVAGNVTGDEDFVRNIARQIERVISERMPPP